MTTLLRKRSAEHLNCGDPSVTYRQTYSVSFIILHITPWKARENTRPISLQKCVCHSEALDIQPNERTIWKEQQVFESKGVVNSQVFQHQAAKKNRSAKASHTGHVYMVVHAIIEGGLANEWRDKIVHVSTNASNSSSELEEWMAWVWAPEEKTRAGLSGSALGRHT